MDKDWRVTFKVTYWLTDSSSGLMIQKPNTNLSVRLNGNTANSKD